MIALWSATGDNSRNEVLAADVVAKLRLPKGNKRPSITELAELVRKWEERDSIPSPWWEPLLRTRVAREAGLTADKLVSLAAKGAAARRRGTLGTEAAA